MQGNCLKHGIFNLPPVGLFPDDFKCPVCFLEEKSNPPTPKPTTSPDTVEAVAKYWSDWLVDAVAGATQDRQFLRGEPEENKWAIEAILLNGKHAIKQAIAAYEARRK